MKWELGTKYFSANPNVTVTSRKARVVMVGVRAELSPLFMEEHFHWKFDKLWLFRLGSLADVFLENE